MSDIAEVTEDAEPKPMTLRVKGVEYSVLPFNMIQVGKIQKAIKTLPCPYNTRAVRKEWNERFEAKECSQQDMERAITSCAARENAWPPRVMEDDQAQSLLMYEEAVQVAMVRTALKIGDDAAAVAILEAMRPIDYVRMVFFCFQVGESADDPKSPQSSTSEPESPSTTTPLSATSSHAPDGPENTSSGSASPTSSDTPG